MLLDAMRALARRWYLIVLGLILTAGLMYGAFHAVPPEYSARALVLLLPSKVQVGAGGNPFLELSGLEQPAGILGAYFSSTEAQAEVENVSDSAKFEVSLDPSVRGPVLAVDVTDSSSDGAQATLNHLLSRIPLELARLQREVNAEPDATIGSMVLTADVEPKASLAGNVRSVIAAMVVGLAGTGLFAYAFDGSMQRRRVNRRPAKYPDVKGSEVSPSPLGSADAPAMRGKGSRALDPHRGLGEQDDLELFPDAQDQDLQHFAKRAADPTSNRNQQGN